MTGRQLLLIGAVGASLAFTGCATADEVPDEDQCGAAALQGKIGAPVLGTSAQDLQIDGERVTSAKTVRVVGPDQPMTMDFRLDRLTIEVDEDRNLVSARCV